MKKLLFTFVLISISFFSIELKSQTGKVIENLSFESKILKEQVNYCVYLPSDYESSELYYPALYLLHGYSDNETAWIQFGEVHKSADKAIADRKTSPMIIIMPDAKITWYINNYNGTTNYEDMFIKELIPYMESKYRIRSQREFRAISGLSMGGYGSLILSLHHPDKFVACAPFSAGVFTDEEIVNIPHQQYREWFATVADTTLRGKDRLTEHWYNNSVLEQMKKVPERKENKVRYYIDCGDKDFLYKGNSSLHILMRDLDIPHEYRVRSGSHNWEYWRTGITDALIFVGNSFHR